MRMNRGCVGDLYVEGTPANSANPIKHIAVHIPRHCAKKYIYYEFISKAYINMIMRESFQKLLFCFFVKSAFFQSLKNLNSIDVSNQS